jgi:hypothetical protein
MMMLGGVEGAAVDSVIAAKARAGRRRNLMPIRGAKRASGHREREEFMPLIGMIAGGWQCSCD